jgi:hypothetical protein
MLQRRLSKQGSKWLLVASVVKNGDEAFLSNQAL